jgi:hypothetical protein
MQSRRKMRPESGFALPTGKAGSHRTALKSQKLKDVLLIADEAGLLKGSRTKVVRGRMPEALVNKAKARTGIKKDTDLIEVALANLAVADDFPEWLLSQTGTVSKDLDLEF